MDFCVSVVKALKIIFAVLQETFSSTTVYAQCSINSVVCIKLEALQLMSL